MTILLSSAKTIFMKENINMEKQKRITLNADKRKVIADVFQNHFEDNSKFKKSWQDAKDKLELAQTDLMAHLKHLEREGHLNRTLVIVMADHGHRCASFLIT